MGGHELSSQLNNNINAYNLDLVNMEVVLPMLAHDGSAKSEGDFGEYDLDKSTRRAKKKDKKDKTKKKDDWLLANKCLIWLHKIWI